MVGITGIGSGIDIDSIVKATVDSERAPKELQLSRLEKATTSRISALGSFRSVLSELNTALQGLSKLSAFQRQSVSSSNSSVLTVTANGEVPPANYSLQVQQLASTSKVALQSVSGGNTATFNTGKISISAGNSSFDINITTENNSLAGIRTAINAQGEAQGISASIVTDASGSRLVLSSNKTGDGRDLHVVVSDEQGGSGQNSLKALAFSLEISSTQLARVSGGADATFKAGTLTLASGTETLGITVEEGDDLASILDKINDLGAGQGFSASMETVAGGAVRLMVHSSSGEPVTVSAESDGSGEGDNELSALASVEQANARMIDQAKSARFTVDGLSVVKDSNSISDVIEGVTIRLAAVQSDADIAAGKTVNITVGQDRSLARTNLQKFVDAYNKLIQTTSELTAVVQVGEGKAPVTGALLGDTSVRNLLTGMRKELIQFGGTGGGVQSLAELGITTGKDGKLSLDAGKLDTALAGSNYDKVTEFLGGPNGVMNRLAAVTAPYVATNGVLDQRHKGLQTTISSIDKQRTDLNLRIEKVQARLYAQYNAMDSLVGRLRKTSENLTGMLASLPGFVRKDK